MNPPPASETKKAKKKRPESNRGSKEHSVDESIYGRNYSLNFPSNEYFDQNGTPIVDYGSGEYGLAQPNQQMARNQAYMPDNVMAANIVAGGVVVSR